MIIVFDTNVWKENLYLRSPAGAAARFFISQKKARVALPEVVRLEVEHHLRTEMRKLVTRIKEDHERLLAIFGKMKEIVLPSHEQIESKVLEVFASLGMELIEIPFCLESARSSFLKTIYKEPPSDRTQEFKDGVLWADCLSLLKDDEVVLVTNDKAFFEDHKYENGLARSLREDVDRIGGKLTVHAKFAKLLKEIRTEIDIDQAALEADFLALAQADIDRLLNGAGFQLGERSSVTSDLFVTEKLDSLFIEFELTYLCVDLTDNNRSGILKARGDGYYHPSTKTFSNLGQRGTELIFDTGSGEKEVRSSVFMRAQGIILGHRDVVYSVRKKLYEEEPNT